MKVPKYILYLTIDYNVIETTHLQNYSLEEAIEVARDRISLIDFRDEEYQTYISIGQPYPDDIEFCAVPSVAIVNHNRLITDQKGINYVFKEHFH